MEILSFNVNGIRAISKKTFFEDMHKLNPDVICLQETKATVEQVKETVSEAFSDYEIYANEAERKGYSGTAIISKVSPISVSYDIGVEEHDSEGRVICAEFDSYFLITVYTPNSGSELKRLDYRQRWDMDFLKYVKNLEKSKPVIICGDLNVAHKSIDLARPKANYNKSAGYMQEEIDGLDAYIENGFVDTFRLKNNHEIKYSWWSYRGGARYRNIGWRIDYFLVSNSLQLSIKEANILNQIMGSDHCPVLLKIG
ncbi:MAG: exodeoxyribonuclease III [Crocinitomicaceae bacterium]|nr:exodeoxyribonuclease III [Crocinitomicaceae bacterium]|tara:strand:- start:7 stop:771 length:765 start_codon:yes stop_codon:yes gene_type:complete